MDRVNYLDELIRLAQSDDDTAPNGTDRASYLSKLTELARSFQASTPRADNDVAAALAAIKPNASDILHRLAGAIAQRKRRLNPRQRTYLSVLETTPDLLSPIAQQRSERAHMAAIAFFLDARRAGAVGEACLEAFKQLIIEHRPDGEHFDELHLTNATVEAERDLAPHGRVDIAIESNATLIYVEGKVDASEGPSQLLDYSIALAKHAGSRARALVYLTRDGATPPGRDVRCVHLSFSQLLARWLPTCADHTGGTANYLAAYLKTVAAELIGCAAHGGFDAWSLSRQRKALEYLENERWSGGIP